MEDVKYAWEGKGLDETAAKELFLFIQNDADLYRQRYTPINKNLVAKKARGVYQSGLAAKLFGYLVESGAKKYAEEFSSSDTKWNDLFPKKLRDAVAEELRDYFETEYGFGNYDSYIPKKYQPKAVRPAIKKKRTSRKSSGTAVMGGMR